VLSTMSASPVRARHRRRGRTAVRLALAGTLGLVGLAGIVQVTARPASAAPPSIAGYATNFDVPNGTDKECEGFEVEIEDISHSQVTYTWPGAPSYPNPYGAAGPSQIVDTTFPDGHSGVRVTFAATYAAGTWSASTPIGVTDHFGVHDQGTPGVQRYSWLCDVGGRSTGSTGILTPYGGTTSGNFYPVPSVPSIVPSVVPTATGEGVQQQVTPAVVPQVAEPRFPDAVWVLKYRATSNSIVDVNNLLIGDPEVQAAITNSNISSVAELFQPDPGTNRGVETEGPDHIVAGEQSDVTVTETYHYTGPVDPVDNSIICNEIVGDPNNCNHFVGSLISRQMQATLLNAVTPRAPLAVTVSTGATVSGTGGNVTSDPLPGNASPNVIDCGSDGGSCFTDVDAPSTVRLTATPNAGYVFHGWGGDCSGTATTCLVPVTAAKNVTANFVLPITISTATPPIVHPGQTAKLALTGVGFLKGAALSVSGTGVAVSMVTASPAKIKATVTVSSGAAIGARDLVVTNKNGQMGICRGCLTVYRPTISGLSPNSFARGVSKVAGVLSGTGFDSKAKASVSGAGVTVKTTVVGPGQLGLQITVSPAATTGIRDVIVVNHDGASVTLVGGFTVN
jgi:uncharacterized repeat protein (TIGR02543 family)